MSPAPRKPSPHLYLSPGFVLSAGCVLFHFSRDHTNVHNDEISSGDVLQVCILHWLTKDEWLLPKGRKDEGESFEEAATRETFEETGYRCSLLGVDLQTRSPPRGVNIKDNAAGRLARMTKEPFMVTQRTLEQCDVKFTFWYVAKADLAPPPSAAQTNGNGVLNGCGHSESARPVKIEGTQTDDENFASVFLDADAAVERLTFESDKEVVREAIALVRATYFDPERQPDHTNPPATL